MFSTDDEMQVEVVLQEFRNSSGAMFPPCVLKDIDLMAGLAMTLATTGDGKITLPGKRRYTLWALITKCNLKARHPADMALWDAAPMGKDGY